MIDDAALEARLAGFGLETAGVARDVAFAAADADRRGDVRLIGPAPGSFWAALMAAPEGQDGAPDPIDRYSRRVGEALAAEFGAEAAYPFGGPPYAPFLTWALATGGFFASPIGPLVSRRRGLWGSFRLALLFQGGDGVPRSTAVAPDATPCAPCAAPCRTACPVDAFGPDGFDARACAAHVASEDGVDCRQFGCLARRACPFGAGSAPEPARAAHHMAVFVAARRKEGML